MAFTFTCTRSLFQRGLDLVSHAVAGGTPEFALLAYLRLELDAGRRQLKLQATNLHMGMTTWVPVERVERAEEAGVIAVPAKMLRDLFATLPEGSITFTIDYDVWSVIITHPSGSAKMLGLDASQFPPIPDTGEGTDALQLPSAFAKAIRSVGVAVARDDARPVLACVLVQGKQDHLALAAADGYRVSYAQIHLPPTENGSILGNLLIPYAPLAELAGMVTGEAVVTMSVSANRSQVLFSTQWFVCSIILLTGEFPNYRAFIPEERAVRVVVNTEDFLRCVRSATVFTSSEQLATHLLIQPNKGLVPGTLTVLTATERGSNSYAIPAQVNGPLHNVAFNTRILYEILKNIPSTEAALEIGHAATAKTPAPAGILMPAGTEEAPFEMVHCFMSMKG